MRCGAGGLFVQAQAGVDQALHGLLQVRAAQQARGAALARQAVRARGMHPGLQQFGVLAERLLQVAAAQPLVAERVHVLHQQRVGGGQGIVRGLGLAAGEQGAVVGPPEGGVGDDAAAQATQARVLRSRGLGGGPQRRNEVACGQIQLGPVAQHVRARPAALLPAHPAAELQRAAQVVAAKVPGRAPEGQVLVLRQALQGMRAQRQLGGLARGVVVAARTGTEAGNAPGIQPRRIGEAGLAQGDRVAHQAPGALDEAEPRVGEAQVVLGRRLRRKLAGIAGDAMRLSRA